MEQLSAGSAASFIKNTRLLAMMPCLKSWLLNSSMSNCICTERSPASSGDCPLWWSRRVEVAVPDHLVRQHGEPGARRVVDVASDSAVLAHHDLHLVGTQGPYLPHSRIGRVSPVHPTEGPAPTGTGMSPPPATCGLLVQS